MLMKSTPDGVCRSFVAFFQTYDHYDEPIEKSPFLEKGKYLTFGRQDINRQFHQRLNKILAPKNFKPKTQLYNFWRQNFVQKTRA